jgi:peptidoglycan hydrolase CwlO-like protein
MIFDDVHTQDVQSSMDDLQVQCAALTDKNNELHDLCDQQRREIETATKQAAAHQKAATDSHAKWLKVSCHTRCLHTQHTLA